MKIPIITGYTATGKTEIALLISKYLPVEIISADAFQVYKYMDIGTAKPSKEELSAVKHHLIDILEPDETYSAGVFFEKAEQLIEEISKRCKIPIIVGGTGLYVETLKKGLFVEPALIKELRPSIEKELSSKGISYFYQALLQKDPIYAQKISKNDRNKILRAFEIMESTGLTVTEAHKKYHRQPKFLYNIYVIEKNRIKLYDDINKRVINMFSSGWVDEVKRLLDRGFSPQLHSFKAIGYREIAEFLCNSNITLQQLINYIQTKTRQFAKRQITWFKHMDGIKRVDYGVLNIDNLVHDIELNYFGK
ncbi:MAG: tRNA (adenosine(37)-N6)-dimethylallyltransferase MiaA [Calditerrivibrio sp.]|nr:tRNA (adenosine(37)-N6)-dimethylallyltransferase MiaA [Calditerrivibrio sp.]